MGTTIWAVAVAVAGPPESRDGAGDNAVLEDRRSNVETFAEGAAAMIGTDPVDEPPDPAAGVEFPSFPAVFTGAESVAKELGD
ncbi:MAG: hypothetical protein LBH51_09455 [Treponema sp.]|nr:hypothetical protein [Treponema sp.]